MIWYCTAIGSRICYLQPKYDADRTGIADDCIKTTGYCMPLLIDPVSVDNIFNKVIVYSMANSIYVT
jgi:hypothetical protein